MAENLIMFDLSPEEDHYLKKMLDVGLYGENRSEVAYWALMEAVRKAIIDNLIEVRDFDVNPLTKAEAQP